jgi:hypothetical protein
VSGAEGMSSRCLCTSGAGVRPAVGFRPAPGIFHLRRYIDGYGRQRQFKLGSADLLSLEQARRLGQSALAKALLGDDPQT